MTKAQDDHINDDRVACRTPTEGRDGVTRLPKWKFDCLAAAISSSMPTDGSEVALKPLRQATKEKLSPEQLEQLGSLSWHFTTVRLELEVRGEIVRSSQSPVRLKMGQTYPDT